MWSRVLVRATSGAIRNRIYLDDGSWSKWAGKLRSWLWKTVCRWKRILYFRDAARCHVTYELLVSRLHSPSAAAIDC